MEILAKLKAQGWYLSDDGLKKLPDDVDKSDTRKIIQAAMDMDFREIAGGALPTDVSRKDETIPGRIVLQITKTRNMAAPKADEESRYAPRLFQLELTDGINQVQALEIENIPAISFNTPPGTKIYLKCEKVPLLQGMLMLRSNDVQILGGKVTNLYEKWEMSRTLLKYAKGGRVMNGGTSGPPPWTAFGTRIQQQNVNAGNDKNFKSLAASSEKEGKENNEFDAMRNEAIAEAAKAGSKKIFGGGNQQIVDHNVKKILEKGYSEEEAKNALRATRNILEKALSNLKRREEFRNKDDNRNSGYDKSKSNLTSNERNSSNIGKRGLNSNARDNFSNKKSGKDDIVPTKPVGNVSLFDFLTDKLPSNSNETEKQSSSSQNQQHYGTSSSHQQSSRYESRNERSSRQGESYNSSNSKPSYYNSNNNNNSQQQQSSSYSENRNQNNQQNQHHIPNNQSNRGSMNQKFENNLSSSFQANRNYFQDERPRNRNNRESTERSGTGSLNNTGSNRSYQNSYQGRSGGGNDRQYDEQSSDRYYNSRDQRNNNYNQRNSKSQINERDGGTRSGGNDRNNYQGSNTSHFQYHQHQNNNGSSYDNRNSRNDNQSYRNGYDNSRSGGGNNSYQSNKGNHSQNSSRYSQKESSNSYQQNQSSNNSRNYTDNRQQSYHHQQQQLNQNSDVKLNKIIEDTSKLKIDQQSQQQQQQQQQQLSQQQQQHSQKSRHNQTTSSHRNQNLTFQQPQQHIVSQHQPQIMTVVSHQGPPPNQAQIQQHAVQTNQQPHPHFQPPPQVHSAQHSLQTSAYTQLPNGFAYDPNKIMGFQNKETNDFAMTLLKSQGIQTSLTPTTALAPPQPPHPHPSVTPNAAPQSTTPHPGPAAYQTMQIGHPPPPTISQHSFATAGPAFVMQPTSIAAPQQLATMGPQVAHTHTPVTAGLASLQGPPQQNPGAAFSMNSGESWNWKIGDRCLAKYWDDARYYEAEITGISDKTCVVFYLGYGNHEEVLKLDCLPITDAQNRAINFGTTQAATVVAIQPQHQPPPPTAVQLTGASRGGLPNRYRGDRQMYVPPPKRDG